VPRGSGRPAGRLPGPRHLGRINPNTSPQKAQRPQRAGTPHQIQEI
jgi:hypothetical protein